MKDDIKSVLGEAGLCVLSTVDSEGKPEAAIVGYSANEKLEIMIGTSRQSRKFTNISLNAAVALVFGPTDDYHEVQYEGTARELSGDELQVRKAEHLRKNPGALKYEDDPEQCYLLVTPAWARLVQSGPVFIGEIREFDS